MCGLGPFRGGALRGLGPFVGGSGTRSERFLATGCENAGGGTRGTSQSSLRIKICGAGLHRGGILVAIGRRARLLHDSGIQFLEKINESSINTLQAQKDQADTQKVDQNIHGYQMSE